ncbi:hypothetical protein F5Y07DRAFT_380654 [Xylaria sp. FL0933]|nr:hypothetical protein F5Y07DRAFT_380654 [Xylaria sp. FL0933]
MVFEATYANCHSQIEADSRWIAQMQDLHVNIPHGSILSSGERNLAFQQDDLPSCPSLAFTYENYSGPCDDYSFEVVSRGLRQ